MRRWPVAVLVLLGLLALACEGTGEASPTPTGKPEPGLPASMAALGDSITVGWASCDALIVCGYNSWSTGTSADVDSHYLRIKDANAAISGHEHDYARPGAASSDLARQAGLAVRAKAGYVTILIGANDACAADAGAMTGVDTFKARVTAGLTVLKKGLPKAKILIVSIPDLYRLWQVGHADAGAVRAWNRGICPSMLKNPTSTAKADNDRRRQVDARIDAYDDVLAGACRTYGKNCQWDGGAVHSVRFDLTLVNHLDYFHPNAQGQRKLAQVSYPF